MPTAILAAFALIALGMVLTPGPNMIYLTAGSIATFFAGRPAWLSMQRWLMGGVLGALAVRMAM